jgi:hypothetical protein
LLSVDRPASVWWGAESGLRLHLKGATRGNPGLGPAKSALGRLKKAEKGERKGKKKEREKGKKERKREKGEQQSGEL